MSVNRSRVEEDKMYVLLIAAELYGRKHNMEIGFPTVPTLDELAGHCEQTFNNESRRLRPDGCDMQRVIVDNIKIFDDSLNRWLDLTTTAQLLEWSQLYLVQCEGNESGEQGILEAPIRLRSPLEHGTDKEKFFFLFHDMDFNGNGHISREELQRVFNVFCLYGYSEQEIDKYFHTYDTNRDGVLSFAEFTKWMQNCPKVGEAMLRKSVGYWSAWNRRPEIRDSAQITRVEREAILNFLDRNNAMTQDVRRQQEEMRRVSDERLLQERDTELSKARGRFVKKYGYEPSPSPNRETSARIGSAKKASAKK